MKLRYILGNSGTGKTHTCLREIISKENGNTQLIYIVPEQFTLEAEKNIINMISQKTIINTQVLSFKRLGYHLFSETGGIDKKLLENEGKTMLLRKLVYDLKNQLTFFTRAVDKQGFLENLSTTITEFFRYGITPDKLFLSLDNFNSDDNMYHKLKDIHLIYHSYLEYIHTQYISTDETLDILADKVKDSSLVRNADIWIDNFNAFTPQEYKVITQLMQYANSINISLPINSAKIYYEDINTFDAYFETQNTINTLCKIAKENNVVIDKPLFLNTNHRHINNSEMSFLTENYLSYDRKIYSDITNNINVASGSNIYEEINYTCNRIIKLIRDCNYKYNDIAIILSSEDYEKPLKNMLDNYKIPNFLDSKKSIISHPLTELIRSCVDIVVTNWSYEAVFRMLKTQLMPMSLEEIDYIENYVLAYGIKGYRWKQDSWDYGFEYTKDFDHDDINYLKNIITDSLNSFTSAIKPKGKYTVQYISTKLFDLLQNLNITDTLNNWIDRAIENGNSLISKEHSQIWGIITNIFDKMVEILGDQEVTIYEFSKIINAGLSASDMGLLPPTQDHIIIGDIERTKLPDVKAIFILGVNEGLIPAYKEDNGMFSDQEKELMSSYGFELSADNKRKITQERFAIYSTLIKAKERLYLTYSSGTLDGNTKRPSSIVFKICSMFPLLNIVEIDSDCINIDNIMSPSPVFEQLTSILSDTAEGSEIPDLYKDVYTWFSDNPKYKLLLNNIENGLYADNPVDFLPATTADKLYGNSLYTSVTQLELYNKCPFSFFMRYGLKAKDRRLYQLNPPDIGTLFHSILEDFSKSLTEKEMNWRDLQQDDIETMVDQSIDKLAPKLGTEILLSSPRYQYMIKRLKRITHRSVWALAEHIKGGLFEPLGYEIGFGINEKLPPIIIELKNGKKIILTGKIDRVDVLDADGNSYVKILDYKSYSTKCELDSIYYGMQLQLVMYLDAFLKKGGKLSPNQLLPGGMFYFNIDDPIIKINSSIAPQQLEEAILEDLSITGLALDSPQVLNALDKGLDTSLSEKDMLKKIKNVNSPILANIDQFNALRTYVNEMVTDIGTDMLNGCIKIEPYKKGSNDTGCQYCKYPAVCRLEVINKERPYKYLRPLDKKNIWYSFGYEPTTDDED